VWVLLSMGLAALAVCAWSLVKGAADADRQQAEWLADDDPRRTPSWRRI
jgi:hypothetical protein